MKVKPWLKSYPPEIPYSIDYPHLPMKDYFNKRVEENPDRTYLIYENSKISYREANTLAQKLANGLINLGYKKQDRIAIMAPNIPQFVIAIQACFKIGAVIVPINPMYTVRELTHQFRDSESSIVLVTDQFADKVIEIMHTGGTSIKKIIVINNQSAALKIETGLNIYDYEPFLEDLPDAEPVVSVSSEDIALLQYTGGTTGTPKGCILSNFNLEAMSFMDWYWLSPPLKGTYFINLCTLPLYHIYSFNSNMILNMIGGGTIILVAQPSPDNILKNINQHKPNYFPAVPAMIAGLTQHPDISHSEIKCIKVVMSGGSPLAPEVKKTFENLSSVDIVEGYGLSETTQILTGNPTMGKKKAGTVGLPFPDTDIRIVDLNDGLTEVAIGEMGELIARGPQIMPGYWKNEEETALAVRDGWLYTGDIACMDEEGYITIKDRKKDVIYCNGLKVYPNEVDRVLSSHAKVLEACTIGFPDPKQGERVKAFIVLKPGAAINEKEIIEYCRERLAPYKVPKDVQFIDVLPKTRVGKPNRLALRQR